MWSRQAREDAERAADAPQSAESALEVRLLKQDLRVLEDEYAALEQQESQLLAEIKQLQSSGQALQASMKGKQKKPLRQEMARKRKERILLKKKIILLAPPGINDLPPTCLLHVLVTAVQSDDMLGHAALASRVCAPWRRAIMNRDPYARGLYDDPVGERPSGAELQLAIDSMAQEDDKDLVETGVRGGRLLARRQERARLLGALRAQLKLDPVKQAIGQPQPAELGGLDLRDEGARAAACALGALPAGALLSTIVLRENGITESGFRALGEALRGKRFGGGGGGGGGGSGTGGGLQLLDLGGNPEAGDDGVREFIAVAGLGGGGISGGLGGGGHALSELCLEATGCGDGGMVALAAALPSLGNWAQLTTKPATLRCGRNPDVGEAGWAALAEALPQLLGLAELDLGGCHGMGDPGAVPLCQALIRQNAAGGGLNRLTLDRCGIGREGGVALAHVVKLTPSLLQLNARHNVIEEAVQAAIRAVAKPMRLKLRLKEL
jgi:hypothetical protein